MDAVVVENWLRNAILHMETIAGGRPVALIMDNAPYHSRQKEKPIIAIGIGNRGNRKLLQQDVKIRIGEDHLILAVRGPKFPHPCKVGNGGTLELAGPTNCQLFLGWGRISRHVAGQEDAASAVDLASNNINRDLPPLDESFSDEEVLVEIDDVMEDLSDFIK
ncbi:unnamed protein product [Cylicocyclus nassatus]|uniref:Uncharacterized protein n=1 Tax=Cylicocyclus nassatus TaxID=53992 RepID=A0AA36DRP7_CYLNA|nr:unnamed protein product [Cylicocyclus nassatus]